MMANIESGDARRRVPWRMLGWGGAAALLLIPLLGNWPWTPSDYVFAGILFGGVGLGIELACRISGNSAYRLGAALALVTALLLIWINAAVGIIGNENNPANLVYVAILAIGAIGALVAMFRPSGMARAMTVTGSAHALVAVGILVISLGATDPPGAFGLLMLNGIFVALWLASAALFRRAASGSASTAR